MWARKRDGSPVSIPSTSCGPVTVLRDRRTVGEHTIGVGLSLRISQLKHKKREDLKASVGLTHGCLLIMRGGTQVNWLCEITKKAKRVDERLNPTFQAAIAARDGRPVALETDLA
jgi:hypothetical protein